MKRKLIGTAAFIFTVAAAFATSAYAQARHDEKPHGVTKAAETTSRVMPGPSTGGRHGDGPHGIVRASGSGVVKSIDAKEKKITLEHESVKRLQLDASTHEFRVKNAKSLLALKEGDKVDFVLEKSGPGLVVVQLGPQKVK